MLSRRLGMALLLALSWSPLQAADKILLKTQTAYPTQLPIAGTGLVWVADRLRLLSDGQMRMKLYEPNKLVGPSEILDAVSTGKIQAGFAVSGNWQGKIPAAALFSAVPFGPEAGEYMAWFYYGNGLSLYQQMYDQAGYQVKPIPCGMIPPETSGWFKRPVDTLDDLEGLNVRYFGLGAAVLNKLGVSTLQLPAGEIFGALEKGAIDGAELSQPAIDVLLGVHKVAKYSYFPGWHQQATVMELLINRDSWQRMSQTQQALLETTCQAAMANTLAEGESLQFPVLEQLQRDGVEIRNWSPELMTAFEASWNEVVAERREADPFFKQVWDDLELFRSRYAVWQANGFLPRKE